MNEWTIEEIKEISEKIKSGECQRVYEITKDVVSKVEGMKYDDITTEILEDMNNKVNILLDAHRVRANITIAQISYLKEWGELKGNYNVKLIKLVNKLYDNFREVNKSQSTEWKLQHEIYYTKMVFGFYSYFKTNDDIQLSRRIYLMELLYKTDKDCIKCGYGPWTRKRAKYFIEISIPNMFLHGKKYYVDEIYMDVDNFNQALFWVKRYANNIKEATKKQATYFNKKLNINKKDVK